MYALKERFLILRSMYNFSFFKAKNPYFFESFIKKFGQELGSGMVRDFY